MRNSKIVRKTAETDIELALEIDGSGKSELKCEVGFLKHMLELFAKYSRFDLQVDCKGDVWVDDHHTVEDIGIWMGLAFAEAVGDKRGICRYGDSILPMDEALVLCAADLSGRGVLCCELDLKNEKVGTFVTELVKDFLAAFTRNANITLHVRQLAGENTHHIIEAVFKALGQVLRKAVSIDEHAAGEIPSTKGVL